VTVRPLKGQTPDVIGLNFETKRDRSSDTEAMATFDISDKVVGDVAVVTITGDITPGRIEGVLSGRMLGLVNKGHKKLVLNLEGIPTIDSIGLGEIVRSYTSVVRHGARLKLAAVPRKIVDLLRVTRLIMAFELAPSEADAIASFK
jgi:anti-sigma B factor antagonist